ncbi:hypothetical protein DCAR_0102371 [Daucus carota subsp. sativus]|uniref:S-protein homolog n=1 Tax=Daucus carota subsp. sativus TaxID=79200 RepID=A0AAF0W4R4_DAUCS|nr:hypothetical protein DCAR_0102371 [Daucus carota subsp. sativus]
MSTNSSISLMNILTIFLLLTTCMSKKHIKIDITDRLPSGNPSLRLHCKSKDDDLGFHTLGLNQVYEWRFNMNFWLTTLYWCNFWWDGKYAQFNVFDDKIWGTVGEKNVYSYVVRPDGFYLRICDFDTHTFVWKHVNNWGN